MTRSATEVIVDDSTSGQTTSTGTWQTENTDPGYYSAGYHRKAAGTGAATFTWTPPVTGSQSYLVYLRWVADTDHATNAPITVYHAGGSNQFTANMQASGGEWNPVGTFTFTAGQNHRIELSDAANGVVVADAVKLVPASQADNVAYIHADHLDTPRVIMNQANQQLWRWDSDPFGSAVANVNPSGLGAFAFNQRFPGQYWDQETNLHYNYLRDYEPAVGRYIQSDPVGVRGGINTYAYVRGNPLLYTDPYGLWPFGAPGRSQVEKNAPSELQRLVPELTKQEAEQLSKDAIEEIGWGDVTNFPSPIPSRPPRTWDDLTGAQKEFIRDFLNRLPDRNRDAIQKVKKHCEPK
jgi:RHS repeat-associated protein